MRPRETENMGRKADALVFDLGGVLVGIAWDRAFQYWSEQSGVSAPDLKARFQFDDAYAAHERNELNASAYFAHLRSTFEVTLTDGQLQQGWNEIVQGPLEGIPELLSDLSGVLPLYGLTNTNATHYAHWRPRNIEALAPLARIFCSHEMGQRKPSLESFALVAREIGVAPQRIAFFDDLPQNVDGARNAGWQGFTVNGASDIRRALTEELSVLRV